MNKFAVAGIVLSLAVLLGIPPVIGSFTEAQVMAQAQRIETLSGNAYHFEILEYEGGWFGSTARIQASLGEDTIEQIVAMTSREASASAVMNSESLRDVLSRAIPLVIEIGHGPVIVADSVQVGLLTSVIRLDPDTQGLAELLETLDVPYLFEARTLTGITGTSTFAGHIPPFELDYADGRVSFSGFTLEGSYDLQQRQFNSQGAMRYLQVETIDSGSIAVEEFLWTADVTGFSPTLWIGEAVMEIGSASVDRVGPDGPVNLVLTGAGVRMDSALDATGELLTIEGRYYLDSLTGGAFPGPEELNLVDASFDFTLRDLARDALEEIIAYSQLVAISPETAPPLIPGIEGMLYLTLASSPTLEIGPLKFRWNNQPFEASIRIDLDASGLPLRADFSMLNLRVLIDTVSIEAYAEMSEEIARNLAVIMSKNQLRSGAEAAGNELSAAELENMAQTQAAVMLIGLVVQGMIKTSDAGYRSDVTFMNGELNVNGNQIPLGLFR